MNKSRLPEPELPSEMTLKALQAYVARAVAARGFTTDLNEVFILTVEELGELATELMEHRRLIEHRKFNQHKRGKEHGAFKQDPPAAGAPYPENLAFELADLLLYLLDLANGFEVNLADLWPDHERALDARDGFVAGGAEGDGEDGGEGGAARDFPSVEAALPLNALTIHVEAKRRAWGMQGGLESPLSEPTPEPWLILLTETMGELAKELRKHWKGKTTPGRMGAALIDALSYVMCIAHACEVNLEQSVRDKEARNAGRSWDY